MARATARHILVASKEVCEDLKKQIETGATLRPLQRTIPFAHRVSREEVWVNSARARWLRSSIRPFFTGESRQGPRSDPDPVRLPPARGHQPHRIGQAMHCTRQ